MRSGHDVGAVCDGLRQRSTSTAPSALLTHALTVTVPRIASASQPQPGVQLHVAVLDHGLATCRHRRCAITGGSAFISSTNSVAVRLPVLTSRSTRSTATAY
jgi:hypothetical protein